MCGLFIVVSLFFVLLFMLFDEVFVNGLCFWVFVLIVVGEGVLFG